jgi:hypothetical protein
MSARLATGFWVAATMRQVQARGGYAAIMRKGNAEAGAVFLLLRHRTGQCDLAGPAAQSESVSGERRFEWLLRGADEQALTQRFAAEARFDPDFWVVEAECSPDDFLAVFGLGDQDLG